MRSEISKLDLRIGDYQHWSFKNSARRCITQEQLENILTLFVTHVGRERGVIGNIKVWSHITTLSYAHIFFGNLGRGKGSLHFEAPSLRDGRFTTRKIDSHLWPATLFQTHIFCGLRLSSRESNFLSKRALRDEPSTTRKTLDHTFGQLRSQHFWLACCNT